MNRAQLFQHFETLAETPEAVNKLRKLVLDFAVLGRLVAQDLKDEADIGIKPQTGPGELPPKWIWARFPDAVFFQEGPGIRNWQFRTQGIKLLNVKNLVKGQLVLDNSDKFISVEEFKAKYRHFQIEPGDLLFASSGASWGKTAFFLDPGEPVIVNTSTIRLRFLNKRFSNLFLRSFMDSELFKKQLETQLSGMQPNFGPMHLKKVLIPLPPPAEQRRIVAKVEELLALCDELEARQTAAEAKFPTPVARSRSVPKPACHRTPFH